MRNGLLSSLIVLLGGTSFASAQGYPVYYPPVYPAQAWYPAPQPYAYGYAPAFPAYHAPRAPAWPVAYQAPAGPMPMPMPMYGAPGAGWAGVAMQPQPSYPQLPPPFPLAPGAGAPSAPPAAPAAPAPAAAPPGKASVPPGEPIPAPLDDTPREPMVSPYPSSSPPAPRMHAEPAPSPGTPLVCEEEVAPEAPAAPLSHELHPPHHGPRGYRVYGDADYLFWIIRERSSPILLSTGILGGAGGTPVLPNLSFDNQQRQGTRATVGTWLTGVQTVGVEVSGFWLQQRTPQFITAAPVLARPFNDASVNSENAVFLGAPGVQSGAAQVTALSRLWGAESNLRFELARGCLCHVDLLGGFRYLQMEDALAIDDRTTFDPALAGLGGTTVASSDRFTTRNYFYGGQIGAEAELHYGRFFLDTYAKVALGSIREVININGTTVLTSAAGLTTAIPGGLLALPSNSGHNVRYTFAAIPEAGVNLGMQLTSHLRARFGYTFLYVSNVVRAGDQIDRTLNPTARPPVFGPGAAQVGPTRPLFAFQEADFWAQGLNVGLEFRY